MKGEREVRRGGGEDRKLKGKLEEKLGKRQKKELRTKTGKTK